MVKNWFQFKCRGLKDWKSVFPTLIAAHFELRGIGDI
jgi:hypothetical protein